LIDNAGLGSDCCPGDLGDLLCATVWVSSTTVPWGWPGRITAISGLQLWGQNTAAPGANAAKIKRAKTVGGSYGG